MLAEAEDENQNGVIRRRQNVKYEEIPPKQVQETHAEV